MVNSKEICALKITDASVMIRKKEITSCDLVGALLERINAVRQINAYISVFEEEVVQASKKMDEEIRRGKYRGPLHGIPISLKDNIMTKGKLTSAGSRILSDNFPERDARVVELLERSGAVIIGKNNLQEFAYGPTGEDSYYGPCRNPWNPEMISGGSSSGSAAAVAAEISFGSIGTDTGGSGRIPCSYCGCVGLKPTYGEVSLSGILPLSWSLDHVAVIARTVKDSELILNSIQGNHERDVAPHTRAFNRDPRGENIRGTRIGVLDQYMEDCFDPEIRSKVAEAIETLQTCGASIEVLNIPYLEHVSPLNNLIMACEATSFHDKWLRSRPNDYTPAVRNRLESGYFYTANNYLKALRLRRWFRIQFEKVLTKFDALVSPTCPLSPFRIGQEAILLDGQRVDPRSYIARFVRIYNFLGLPAISVPCGYASSGLPIGFQVGGKASSEATLLGIAYAYEKNKGWTDREPLL